jgi:hypothetical protein
MLQGTLGAVAAAGLAAAGAAHAEPASAAPRWDPEPPAYLPPVPGMIGDRRANELWYQLDQKTYYEPSADITAAYASLNAFFGADGLELGILNNWLAMSVTGRNYLREYVAYLRPVRDALEVVSKVELDNFDTYYYRRSPGLTGAFADFGQGLLYDPRRLSTGDPIHDMDGHVPTGYAVWHAYATAYIYSGIDSERWREIHPLMGFACALQLKAMPSSTQASPPLPAAFVQQAARQMLRLNQHGLDQYFWTFPYPSTVTVPPGLPGSSGSS